MSFLLALMARFSDVKSQASVIAGAITALAAFFGFLPGATALILVGCCAAIAHMFQDVADGKLTSDELKKDLQKLRDAVDGNPTPPTPPAAGLTANEARSHEDEPPATIPFNPSGLVALLLLLAISGSCYAQDRPPVLTSMQLSADTRSFYRNPDGSCVQCSIGMAGVHCNDINAATLLWDTAYGAAVRGGSWPSRVEQYCDQRGIKAWSVTGQTVEETMPWIVWAAKTGRFAAIGAGASHFQTLYGYEPNTDRPWLLCNNNSPTRIDRYTDREFRQLHAASGPWVVILEKPASDPPSLVKWWK